MAQLQENVLSIIAAFSTYARGDGDRGTLSEEQLRQLVQREFADVIANPRSLETAEKVLRCLDEDGNDRVDFGEFLGLVLRVAKACYKELRQGQALGRAQEAAVQEEAGREDDQDQGAETPDTPQTREAPDEEPEVPEGTEVAERDPKRREILGLEPAEQDRNTRLAEENGAPKQHPDTQETERPEQGPNNRQAQDAETRENVSSSLQAPETESAEQDPNCPSETPARDASNEVQVCEAPQQDPEIPKLQLPEQDESPVEEAKPQESHPDPPLHRSHEPEEPEQELSDAHAPF